MEEDPLSAHVFGALLKSASSVRSEVYKKLMARDLTLRQFTAMEVLYREGPVSLGELAGEIALSTETAGKVVAGLEKRNLVARRRDERNKKVVALTTEGGTSHQYLVPGASSTCRTGHGQAEPGRTGETDPSVQPAFPGGGRSVPPQS